jgi:hypothetical protein
MTVIAMPRFSLPLLALLALAVPTAAQAVSTSANLSIAVVPATAISAINLSNSSVASSTPPGTVVGTISVTMSPASPPFSGTLSLGGTNASSFQIADTNLETDGVLPAGTYQIDIIATQAGAGGSPFTVAETITASASDPSASCPRGNSYADGCAGAPPGTPQYPDLLTTYGVNRPPWNVAGVDYYVGIPAGTTLTPWTSVFAACLANPNTNCTVGGGTWQWNPTQSLLRCQAGNTTLTAVDFTAGATEFGIYGPDGGCSGITITDSRFGCIPGVSATALFGGIGLQGNTNFTFDDNTVDESNCLGDDIIAGPTGDGQNPFISQIACTSCAVELKYNFFKDNLGGPFWFGGTMTSFVHNYNVVDSPVTCSPECNIGQFHMNSLSWANGGGSNLGASNATVTYNTEFNNIAYAGSAEFFQMYYNGGGTFINPIVSNNTFAFSKAGCSYILHGSTGYIGPSTTVTNGEVSNNFFDPSGCYGVFYPNSMTPAQGWSSSGNIDMVTGGAVSP